jgi:hypothetical protein
VYDTAAHATLLVREREGGGRGATHGLLVAEVRPWPELGEGALRVVGALHAHVAVLQHVHAVTCSGGRRGDVRG